MEFRELLTIGLGGLTGYFFFLMLIEAQVASRSKRFISPVFVLLAVTAVVSGYIVWTDPTSKFVIGIFFLSCSVISVCLHEFGHAVAALNGGDWEVEKKGYLSLDPLKYSDPFLSIVMPILFMFIGGLPLPGGAVYINEGALRSKLWRVIVSAGGVIANLLGILIIAFLYRSFSDSGSDTFWSLVSFFFLLQIAVVFLNLLPIPPLDGFGIVTPLLPTRLQNIAEHHRVTLGFFPLLLFLIPNPVISTIWEYSHYLTREAGFSARAIVEGRDVIFSLIPKLNG